MPRKSNYLHGKPKCTATFRLSMEVAEALKQAAAAQYKVSRSQIVDEALRAHPAIMAALDVDRCWKCSAEIPGTAQCHECETEPCVPVGDQYFCRTCDAPRTRTEVLLVAPTHGHVDGLAYTVCDCDALNYKCPRCGRVGRSTAHPDGHTTLTCRECGEVDISDG